MCCGCTALPSVRKGSFYVGIGDRVHRTVDGWTSPGNVILVSDSREAMMRDYEAALAVLAEPSFYRLTPGTDVAPPPSALTILCGGLCDGSADAAAVRTDASAKRSPCKIPVEAEAPCDPSAASSSSSLLLAAKIAV